jgi:hypothetical protein
MTREEQDKLFSLYINKDEIRKNLRSPWYEKNADMVMASDGHQLIAIRKDATVGDFPTLAQNPVPLMGKSLGILSVRDMKEALLTLSTQDEEVAHEEEMDCEECGGKGIVEYTYTSKDNEEYYIEGECPICDGSGKTIRYKYVKTGRKVPSKYATITIGKYSLSWKYIENLCKVCDLVNTDKVECVDVYRDCTLFLLNADIIVIIMRTEKEQEYDTTIEYNEQEN